MFNRLHFYAYLTFIPLKCFALFVITFIVTNHNTIFNVQLSSLLRQC